MTGLFIPEDLNFSGFFLGYTPTVFFVFFCDKGFFMHYSQTTLKITPLETIPTSLPSSSTTGKPIDSTLSMRLNLHDFKWCRDDYV